MIPIFELTKQYVSLKKELERVLSTVYKRGNYILGVEVAAFEKEFANYVGVGYGIGVASGTDALTISLRALELKRGDEVIIPVNAYPTYFGVAMSGVAVTFADCREDGNIDPDDLQKRITKRTKAIIVVHLYGNPADITGIRRVFKKLGRTDIKIIEDCAQAHGAFVGKKKVGTFGDIAIFSFYPSKNLGAYGDGGMVLTKNKKIADHVRRLRMYGERLRYESTELSGVSRLDELQAAILRVKLRHLDAWNKKRRQIADQYTKQLDGLKSVSVVPYSSGSCHHLFVIRTPKRDKLKEYLMKHGVGSAIHYPIPLHLTPAVKRLGYKKGDFPMAETVSKEGLSIPIYPELTTKQASHVITVIRTFDKEQHQSKGKR